MTIEPATSNRIAQQYDTMVEDMLRAANLSRYMGTDVLNPVQAEVNKFNMMLEKASVATNSSVSEMNNAAQRSLYQVRLAIKKFKTT